jgi:hypothetical protein
MKANELELQKKVAELEARCARLTQRLNDLTEIVLKGEIE